MIDPSQTLGYDSHGFTVRLSRRYKHEHLKCKDIYSSIDARLTLSTAKLLAVPKAKAVMPRTISSFRLASSFAFGISLAFGSRLLGLGK